MKRINWHSISTAFEYGDLTPLAVIISVAHYGPVLAAHGENVFVAWMVGALIDLLHFRTVRRLFQVDGRKRIIGHALIAIATTAMAMGYHVRFYAGDWLLAAPIPLGIAILAQHAAAQKEDDINTLIASLVAKWRARTRGVIKAARRAQTAAKKAQTEAKEAQTLASQLQTRIKELQEQSKNQQEIIKAWQSLNTEVQTLARVNAKLVTPEQAANIIGVKDVRTVQSRAEKLNGVAK